MLCSERRRRLRLGPDVALASLATIADAHLTRLADTMRLAAGTEAARTHQACTRCSADAIFFSFDSNAAVALNWDKSLIFLEPRKLSPDLDRAFGAMLAHTQGTETYTFRGKPRTVIYRKSPVTGWWYAFGFAEP